MAPSVAAQCDVALSGKSGRGSICEWSDREWQCAEAILSSLPLMGLLAPGTRKQVSHDGGESWIEVQTNAWNGFEELKDERRERLLLASYDSGKTCILRMSWGAFHEGCEQWEVGNVWTPCLVDAE